MTVIWYFSLSEQGWKQSHLCHIFVFFSATLSIFHCILLEKLAELASAVCALLVATGRCDARKVLRSLEWHDAGRRDAQIGRRHVCLAGGRKNHERRHEKKHFRNFCRQPSNY